MKTIKLPVMDGEQVADEIGGFIVRRISEAGLTGGVIGLNGGVDSTTAAALAKRAFDKYNVLNFDLKLELVGQILPSKVNNDLDKEDDVSFNRIERGCGVKCLE